MQKEIQIKEKSEMDKFSQENGFIGVFETSAKENFNIEEAVRFLTKNIIENNAAGQHVGIKKTLGITVGSEQSKSSCC